MEYRNIILVGALVLGIAVVVMMYVRRGFIDLQEQIDAIETVLASMPPSLTSGTWAGAAGGGVVAPPPSTVMPTEEPTEHHNLDDDIDDGAMNGFDEESDNEEDDEHIETMIETDMPEYDLSGTETTGIATLSEPGYYEAGGIQLTVTPMDDTEESENDPEFEVSELEPLAGVLSHDMQEEEDESGASKMSTPATESDAEMGVDADVETNPNVDADMFEAGRDGADETAKDSSNEVVPEADEYAQMTLPELKARLKAVQPETKGLARLKRAEVLDRLRSSEAAEADIEK